MNFVTHKNTKRHCLVTPTGFTDVFQSKRDRIKELCQALTRRRQDDQTRTSLLLHWPSPTKLPPEFELILFLLTNRLTVQFQITFRIGTLRIYFQLFSLTQPDNNT